MKNKRTENVAFRICKDDKENYAKIANTLGVSVSDLARHAIAMQFGSVDKSSSMLCTEKKEEKIHIVKTA